MTTSKNWDRPPVGIVRVEQALYNELKTLLGPDRFKQCVWLDGRFVAWPPEEKEVVAPPSVGLDTPLIPVVLQPLVHKLAPWPRRFAGRTYRGVRKGAATTVVFARRVYRAVRWRLAATFVGSFYRALKRRVVVANLSPVTDVISAVVDFVVAVPAPTERTGPVAGDVLISVGLDWDYPYASAFYDLSKKDGIKIITCCYDLIPVIFPQFCVGDVADKFKEYLHKLSWGSAGVLCISEQTRRDYEAVCRQTGAPQRPTCVITLGDNVADHTGDFSDQIKHLLAKPFILFVSTIERRKNHEVLYRAYHLLCRAGYRHLLPTMVFVGMPGWGVGDLLKDIELDPMTQGLIVQLNHVSDVELNGLYQHALFCVYPSLYEGWGLPVAEALALGKALLISDQGSLPEVGGDLVAYLPPWDARAWADGILDLLTSPDKIGAMELRVRQEYKIHTWTDTAKKVVQFIEQLAVEDMQRSIVLYPGYDFTTEVGLPVGPVLQSTGIAGVLMSGPGRALAAGRYQLQIFDTPAIRTAGRLTITMTATCQNKKRTLCEEILEFKASIAPAATSLVAIDFELEESAHDYAIVCTVDTGCIALSSVLINRHPGGDDASVPVSIPVPVTSAAVGSAYPANVAAATRLKNAATPVVKPRQLFVDVSELVHQDAKTGIQRVVRSVLVELLANPPVGFLVMPVYANGNQGYRYAKQFTWKFAGGELPLGADEPITATKGDVFLGLDLQPYVVPQHADFFVFLHALGVETHFVLYDMLPILMPQYFMKDTDKIYQQWLAVLVQASGVMCISRAVAAELTAWLKQHDPARLSTLKIGWFHLGADVSSSLPSRGLPETARDVLDQLRKRPTFLMVGTLEPRKGHAQTLQAVEQLWRTGADINLVIVGKQGWMMEDVSQSLRSHKEHHSRLFWLEGVSDEYLEQIYAASTCLIAASEGEGFGLPLIEAAHFALPVIARDIPVFKEVAADNAFYFSGKTPEELAHALSAWLSLHAAGNTPMSTPIARLTWKQSTKNLLEGVLPT